MGLKVNAISAVAKRGEHPKDLRKVCQNVSDKLIQEGECVQITGDAKGIRGKVHSALRGNISHLTGDVTNIIGNATIVSMDLDSIPEEIRNVSGGCHLQTLLACAQYKDLL